MQSCFDASAIHHWCLISSTTDRQIEHPASVWQQLHFSGKRPVPTCFNRSANALPVTARSCKSVFVSDMTCRFVTRHFWAMSQPCATLIWGVNSSHFTFSAQARVVSTHQLPLFKILVLIKHHKAVLQASALSCISTA